MVDRKTAPKNETTPSIGERLSAVLRVSAVSAYVGLSRATIYRLERDNLFPGRVKIGARAVGCRRIDLDRWIQSSRALRHSSVLRESAASALPTRVSPILNCKVVARVVAQSDFAKIRRAGN
jgi:prophage regulatory protein